MNINKLRFDLSSKQLLILAIILLFEIIGTITLYHFVANEEDKTIANDFISTSKELTAAIEKEISINLESLNSINALYSVTDPISRDQFKIFNTNVFNRIGSIQALEWIPRVKFEDRSYYESMAYKDGLTEFRFTEEGLNGEMIVAANRDVYYPVFYMEPFSGNEEALGFDLGSDQIRFDALQRAIKIGGMAATSRIKLVQDPTQPNGVLVFNPVKKQDEIFGFALGVYKVGDLITRALGNISSRDYNLVVYDISADEGNQLLDQRSEENSIVLPNDNIFISPQGLHFQQTIKVADREWLILSTPTQAYLNSSSSSAQLILIICIILSFGFFYYIFRNFKDINQQMKSKLVLEDTVTERTLELQLSNLELNQALKTLSDYKTALDASVIVVITDSNGDMIFANEKFCTVSGYSANELIGQNQRILNSGYHTQEFWKNMWTTLGKGKVWQNDIRNKTKDGTFYWVDTTIVPFMDKNNNPYQYLAIRKDITKEHDKTIIVEVINDVAKSILGKVDTFEISWEIVSSIAKYLESDDCVIYVIDENKQSLNQIAAFGAKASGQTLKKKISLPLGKGIVGAVGLSGIPELINNTATDSRYIVDDDVRLSEIAVPIFYDGEVIGVIDSEHKSQNYFTPIHLEVLTNISGLVAVQLYNSIILSQKIEAEKRSVQLFGALEKSNKELQEYAHVVSHDLKSPLRSIDALVSWIKEDNKGKFDKNTIVNLGLIETTLEKMEQLISDILNYSSIDSNANENQDVDLNLVVNNLLHTLIVPDNISIKIMSRLPIVRGDNIKLQQLFQNLISNAIKFSDKAMGIIQINVVDRGAFYEFSIEDNGIGVEEKFHKKIFKMFQSLSDNKESSGIGLAIVKKIIAQYNGEIWVKSGLGKGSTFYFTLQKQFNKSLN